MDPGILDELLHSGGGFDHHVGPEPPHLESSLRIELAKAVYRGCRKNVNCREVKKVCGGISSSVTFSLLARPSMSGQYSS